MRSASACASNVPFDFVCGMLGDYMRHRPFPKMAGDSDRAERASPGGTWLALEKIHGAQLVIGVDESGVQFGKRKAWLADDEPFFGWQLVRRELADAARAMHAETGASLLLYGELF